MKISIALLIASLSAPSAWADTLTITDGFFRVASPIAKAGAGYIAVENTGDTDDRLIGVKSDVARMVELHTHVMENDVMKMVHMEDGFAIPAGQTYTMERGGDHIMFMGLSQTPKAGEDVAITLIFETAGEVEYILPVDLDRTQ